MQIHDTRTEEEDLRLDWAQDFVNKTERLLWADFFWDNALIDRVELARVDGGHGLVPLPDYGNTVTDFEAAVAFLVHDLENGQNYENPGRYLETLGFTRVRDSERQGAGSH
jgi:hypothetical protein